MGPPRPGLESRAGALVLVHHARFGAVDHLEAVAPHPLAPVDVLEVEKVALVEQSDRVGVRAAHDDAARAWLATLAVLGRRARPTWHSSAGLEMCTLYWYFVCGLWGFLFLLVYVY